MPVYSRESVRQFSLQQFVNGAYVSKGYIYWLSTIITVRGIKQTLQKII